MQSKENKQFVRALLQCVFNDHRVDVLDHLVSRDYVEVEPYPGHRGGCDGLKEWYQAMLEAFPDLTWTLELQIAEDDRVVTIGNTAGQHRRKFFEFPATQRRVAMSWVFLHKIADGKVIEGRHFPDSFAFQQQIGEIPPPGGRRPEHPPSD